MIKKQKLKVQAKRPVQKFKESDLVQAEAGHVVSFLDDFQKMVAGSDEETVAISLRVPANVLRMFKLKAKSKDLKYQSLIVKLMKKWLRD